MLGFIWYEVIPLRELRLRSESAASVVLEELIIEELSGALVKTPVFSFVVLEFIITLISYYFSFLLLEFLITLVSYYLSFLLHYKST